MNIHYYVVGPRKYARGEGITIDDRPPLDAQWMVMFPSPDSLDNFPLWLDDMNWWCKEIDAAEFETYRAFECFDVRDWMSFTGGCWWERAVRHERDTFQTEPGIESTRDYWFLDERFERQRGHGRWQQFGNKKGMIRELDCFDESEYLQG